MKASLRSIDVSFRRNLIIFCWALSCLVTPTCEAAPGNQVPELEMIVSRMEQAQTTLRTQQQAYTVIRDYQFFNGESLVPASQILVKIDFQPPSTKHFSIQKAQGSGQGEKIVRKVLEHEQAAAKDEGSHEISSKNYNFKFIRTDLLQGRSCYVLQLIPKQEEKNAIRGEVWIDADTYLIRHIDGELAKSPSWWVKDVHVTLEYGAMAGIWLQTAMHAVAHVRLFGQHVLLAQDVDCLTASNSQAAVRTQKRVAGIATEIGVRP